MAEHGKSTIFSRNTSSKGLRIEARRVRLGCTEWGGLFRRGFFFLKLPMIGAGNLLGSQNSFLMNLRDVWMLRMRWFWGRRVSRKIRRVQIPSTLMAWWPFFSNRLVPNRAILLHFPTSGSNIEGGLFDISCLSALIRLKPKFRTQNTPIYRIWCWKSWPLKPTLTRKIFHVSFPKGAQLGQHPRVPEPRRASEDVRQKRVLLKRAPGFWVDGWSWGLLFLVSLGSFSIYLEKQNRSWKYDFGKLSYKFHSNTS